MLRDLLDKVESMQEQVGNVNKELKILRKNQTEILKAKNTVTEIKNSFDGCFTQVLQRSKNQ